jgi:hypothetical protein
MPIGAKPAYSHETFEELPPDTDGAIFYDCTFKKLNGATLKNCTLHSSKFAMTKPEDIIGLTVTMDCNTFKELEFSPEVFDLLLLLICRSKGNNAKRLAIIEHVVGHDRAIQLLKYTELLER